jgi:hypothetical protein
MEISIQTTDFRSKGAVYRPFFTKVMLYFCWMTIKSKQLYILIGDDLTGKTTLQKLLLKKICEVDRTQTSLATNKVYDIKHPEIKRKYKTISIGNRSYQEKIRDYETVDNYFLEHFGDADIAIISTHLVISDIQQMITIGKGLFFNVVGIFWSNSIENDRVKNSDISALDWNERLVISNPVIEKEQVTPQLDLIAENFVDLLINRTRIS